jgi:hypothetical protein
MDVVDKSGGRSAMLVESIAIHIACAVHVPV